MYAVRNIRLCTKDCLCLYVCPTGATDTENGQIDKETCISGCRICVDACPSHAISLVPEKYPPQQEKSDPVIAALVTLAETKVAQEQAAETIVENTNSPELIQLAEGLALSDRIMAEDLLREAGFMLPQSKNVITLLKYLLNSEKDEDFPAQTVKDLIELLDNNNK